MEAAADVVAIGPGIAISYAVDSYVDPWREPETVLMLHGNAESATAWYGWVPVLGRHFRLVRPDMRGFGASTAMPESHRWSLDELVSDNLTLLDHLGVQRVHVVASKIACYVALKLAHDAPVRVMSLTLAGPPPPVAELTRRVPPVDTVRKKGVEGWARENMAARLGPGMPPEALDWWARFMGRTPATTQVGFMQSLSIFDIEDALPPLDKRALVLVPEADAGDGDRWRRVMPQAQLVPVRGKSYHVAATDPDFCAAETLRFLREV